MLFEVYINDVKDIDSMDQNSEKFIDVLKFTVYDDLRQYCHFYSGLMKKLPPDAKRDNDIEKEREKVTVDLEKISKQQIYVQNQKRTVEDLENYKELKSKISTLKYNKPWPLINDSDLSEYWKYLTKFKKSHNKADGLLHFIRDFYVNLKQ